MGRIANILDLPLDQKFLIVSLCLSVEYLSQLAVERGETEEALIEKSSEFVKKHFDSEISEAKINSSLRKYSEVWDSLTF